MIRKPRLQRITTQPEVFGCAKCGRPSLPHRMFAACQHPVCSECQTGGLTCPKCSTPSTLLVLPSLDSAVEATLAFQCEACQEICPTDAHLCQPIVSAWRARYPTIPETTSDLFPAFALAATQLLTHELPIDKFLEFTVQAVASRSRPVVRPVVPSAAEARTQTVPHRTAAGGGPVKLYWDFDNMNPKFLGCSVDTFYVNLRTALRGRDIEVDEAFAFVAANKDYGNAPDRLSTMLVTVVTSGFKHEAADRSISRAMQTLVDRHDATPGTIVLVSSDKDFNVDVHRARKSGWRVVVVHDARRGSDHERQLSLHASATIHADEFIKVEDVNPVPPAPYLPQHRFKRTTLVVDGETVPVKDLILNAMVVDLANAEVEHEATFCKKEEAHFVNQCPYVHRMPRTVPVDGWRVETDLLVRNRFVDWIVSNPFHDGKWCTNPHPDHNPEVCQFAHKLPNVRFVSGVLVRLDELVPNAAFNYLKDHPMVPGRWCIDDHDPFTCEQGLHRRNEQRH